MGDGHDKSAPTYDGMIMQNTYTLLLWVLKTGAICYNK